jgi:hypothetical protein
MEGLLRMDASGKYVRYTNEQVEALERVYHECPKPSSIRRQQLIKDCPILANIEPKQIKVWFQNRRCDAYCTKPSFLPSFCLSLPSSNVPTAFTSSFASFSLHLHTCIL